MNPPALDGMYWLEDEFLPDAGSLFASLANSMIWDTRIRARKVASCGVPYNYSGIVWPESPMPPELLPVLERVAAKVGFVPNNCLLNFYPDGRSTMGFHRDSVEELVPSTGIAVVSLGAEREIAFRSEADKSRVIRRLLTSGSLLYMTPDLQTDWKHAIEATDASVGGRISLTFRRLSEVRRAP